MINLRKKHVSVPRPSPLVPAVVENPQPTTTPRSNAVARRPAAPVETPPQPARQPARPATSHRPVEATTESSGEGSGLFWIGLIAVLLIGLWRWNANSPEPAPTAAGPQVEQQQDAEQPMDRGGSGPGWWTVADQPSDMVAEEPTDDGQTRHYSQDEIGEALRDALLDSLDRNRDGVIDADEAMSGGQVIVE